MPAFPQAHGRASEYEKGGLNSEGERVVNPQDNGAYATEPCRRRMMIILKKYQEEQ